MKKNFFLTLVLAVLCTAASWAQFAPEAGKMYAFREVTSGLFLDIQTLGINEPNANGTTNNISLSAKPCVIYFGASNGKYTMKNVNGTYAQQASGDRHWNAVIGTTAYEWAFADSDSDGYYTIARADGKFVKMDNATNGAPLYCNSDAGLEFALVEYTDLVDTHKYTTFKASKLAGDTRTDETYLSMTAPTSTSTQVSFKTEPTKFHIIPSAGASILMQRGSEPAKYLAGSTSNYWDAAISGTPYCWVISDEDTDGYVSITKLSNAEHRVGHDGETTAGTGVYVNVGTDCNKWMLAETNIYSATVPTFTNDISTITSYGQYLTRLAIDGVGVYSGGAPSTIDDMYVETPVTGISLEPGVEYTMNLTFPKNQTSQILSAVIWFDKDGDGVYETHLGTTGTKDGNSNDISTVRFTVPADAHQLLTRIRLRLDSSWGITNAPDAAANRMVYDIPVIIAEAPTYTFHIENPSGQPVDVTYNGNDINDGDEVTGVINAGYVEASDIEGYTCRVVVNSNEKTITLVYVKKYSLHIVGAPNGVTLTYNGNEIGEGYYFDAEFDLTQFVVNNLPEGYSWEVSKDTEGKFVVVTFTALVTVENPAAVVALIKRIGGDGVEDKFKFVLEPSLNYNQEVFVIGGEDGKVLIKGSTISAITTGIGWYLNNYAHINIAWNSLNEKTVSGDAYADLSNIPVPTTTETRTSDAMYRYYLNTCTFGYSMTSWTWKRWQQEIDWMALHGINMPLQLVGMEEVWRKFLTMQEGGKRKYGYTDEAAKAFVAGPAFIAWWAMNNLEGWGGTAPGSKSGYNNLAGAGGVQDDAWYARQKALAKQITDRQRELGMQPVLPGWSGMVPTNFASKSGYATRGNGGNWAGDFVRPLLLSVGNANYAEIAADYYKCLHEVMGESHYYSMDPFHEGGGAGTMEDYEALYAAMETAKPGSQWVIQQWQWSETQKYSLTAVPEGRLIVLDLFSDGSPAFDGYNGYAPQDAVFCAIPNFGGRSGLMGRLNNVTDNYFKFKGKYASIKGIGTAPEAIEQTPVAYDLIYQLPWMGTKPDVAEWVQNYSIARYGVVNAELQAAWELLRQGPLNYGADGIQGPVEDVWAARPNLDANKASSWGKTLKDAMGTYNKERQLMLIDATYKLLAQDAAINGELYRSNYLYDVVEFGGAVMADYAYYLLLGIKEAKEASNTALYKARRDAFLQIIRDMDTFRGTNLNFRLGKWTQEARAAAKEAIALGATAANADWYEYNNARTILTTWSSPGTNLTDYSYRSWQGLLKDVYLPRWEAYFAADCGSLEYKFFEWNWAHGMTHEVGQTAISSTPLTSDQAGHTSKYTREPVGKTIDEANKMLGKYIIPLKTDNGTTYAYRYLTNTLSAEYKVEGAEGGTIDLSKFFLANIDGAIVTGDFIDGAVNDIKAVPVKSGIAGNTYDAVMTLTDGTVVNFKVVVNSAEMVNAKEELAALIEKMETLTAQVGSYKSVATEIALTTTQGKDYYIWCNNPHTSGNDGAGGVAALLDEDASTYLHSNYTNKSTTHDYLQIDFGSAVGLDNFKIAGQQRGDGGYDRPKNIEIYGSNDNSTWTPVATVTGLPNSQGATWESDAIYSDVKYSHLKFVVKTHDNYQQTGSVTRPYFHMAKFDIFELSTAADVIDVYDGTELTDAFAAEKYDVLLAAINVYKTATTPEQIAAATAKLQDAYDELLAMVDKSRPSDHAALTKLIADFDALMEKVANVSVSSTAAENVTLQITDANEAGYLYSNAGIKEAGDKGLGALLDDDGDTYIHTAWGNAVTDDGSKHYLRVYLGEEPSLNDFYFSYLTRKNDSNTERPKQITVAGSATIDGEYETIAVLTDLPNASATTYESPIYSVNGYKYLRFMVDDTYRDLTDGNGYKVYTMAKFTLHNVIEKSVNVTATNYATMAGITNDEVAEACSALQAAKDVEQEGTYSEKESEYNSLIEIYNALIEMLAKPFNGVYNINYADKPVFIAYAGANELTGLTGSHNAGFRLFDATTTNTDSGHSTIQDDAIAAQAPADALFTIVPNSDYSGYTISAQGQYMRATGAHSQWSIQAFDTEETNAGTYLFEETGEDTDVFKLKSTINIFKKDAVTNYVNDWGPVFGNDDWNKPNLSTFTLTPVTEYTLTVPESGATTLCLPFNVQLPEGVKAYDIVTITAVDDKYKYELNDVAVAGDVLAKNTPVIINAAPRNYTLKITMDNDGVKGSDENSVLRSGIVRTTIGTNKVNYTFDGVDFNLVVGNTTVPANQCWMELAENRGNIIYKDVVVEPEIPLVLPEVGKAYRIKSFVSNVVAEYQNHYLVNGTTGLTFSTAAAENNTDLWVCTAAGDAGYTFASALGTAALGWQAVAEAEDAAVFTLSKGVKNGCFTLTSGENNLAVTIDAAGKTTFTQSTAKTQSSGWSTDWYLEEVEDATVSFATAIAKGNEWATMYLPYAVAVPQGVEAYVAEGIVEKVVNLTPVMTNIPKNTAVLLRRVSDDMTAALNLVFNLAAGDVAAVSSNLFQGKIRTTAIPATGGARVYLLVKYNGAEKFYWMQDEYNENCAFAGAGNGYVKCDANKAYLRIEEGAKSSSFSFRYEGTTGVEEVKGENGKVKAVYDLQGRKLTEITKPGFYIVDGEKVWVK